MNKRMNLVVHISNYHTLQLKYSQIVCSTIPETMNGDDLTVG